MTEAAAYRLALGYLAALLAAAAIVNAIAIYQAQARSRPGGSPPHLCGPAARAAPAGDPRTPCEVPRAGNEWPPHDARARHRFSAGIGPASRQR